MVILTKSGQRFACVYMFQTSQNCRPPSDNTIYKTRPAFPQKQSLYSPQATLGENGKVLRVPRQKMFFAPPLSSRERAWKERGLVNSFIEASRMRLKEVGLKNIFGIMIHGKLQ